MNVPFHKPYITGKELTYIGDIIQQKKDMSGDAMYTKRAHTMLESRYGTKKALLTTSGTTALEFAVRLLNLSEGDEIIAPSFTFSSTINAILMADGLKVVFAEIDPRTMNIDPNDIIRKISKKTKAIIAVHYAGVACDMDKIMAIAKKHNLAVIEDAAQGIEATYKGKYLGTIGDFGCLSFHDTKNITCGEGGALFINRDDPVLIERAEVMREKGTNRSKFFKGLVDKYTWVDVGSSYLPSDILAAYLVAQLEQVEEITKKRINVYTKYRKALEKYEKKKLITLPVPPKEAGINAHICFMLLRSERERDFLLSFLRSHGVMATFHYVPLHSSPQGITLGNKPDDLPLTESYSKRLLRLPLYAAMTEKEVSYVLSYVKKGFEQIERGEYLPTVSVGIPAYNESSTISSLVTSIFSQSNKAYRLENVIVSCDASTDNTPNIVKALAKKDSRIVLLSHAKRGGKTQRLNELYKGNTSDIIVTFDADVKLANDHVIDELVVPFSDPDIMLVSAYDIPSPARTFQHAVVNAWYSLWTSIRTTYRGGDTVFNVHGNASAIRGSIAKKIVYPENITADQDFLYVWIKKMGGKFYYATRAIVIFHAPDTIKEFYFQTSRFLNEKGGVKQYLPDMPTDTYHIPLSRKLQSIISWWSQQPVYASVALGMYAWLLLGAKSHDVLNESGMWNTALSTKRKFA